MAADEPLDVDDPSPGESRRRAISTVRARDCSDIAVRVGHPSREHAGRVRGRASRPAPTGSSSTSTGRPTATSSCCTTRRSIGRPTGAGRSKCCHAGPGRSGSTPASTSRRPRRLVPLPRARDQRADAPRAPGGPSRRRRSTSRSSRTIRRSSIAVLADLDAFGRARAYAARRRASRHHGADSRRSARRRDERVGGRGRASSCSAYATASSTAASSPPSRCRCRQSTGDGHRDRPSRSPPRTRARRSRSTCGPSTTRPRWTGSSISGSTRLMSDFLARRGRPCRAGAETGRSADRHGPWPPRDGAGLQRSRMVIGSRWARVCIARVSSGGHMVQEKTTYCRICEVTCAASSPRSRTAGSRSSGPILITSCRAATPARRGSPSHEVTHDPDRILYPMKRDAERLGARLVGAGDRRDRRAG